MVGEKNMLRMLWLLWNVMKGLEWCCGTSTIPILLENLHLHTHTPSVTMASTTSSQRPQSPNQTTYRNQCMSKTYPSRCQRRQISAVIESCADTKNQIPQSTPSSKTNITSNPQTSSSFLSRDGLLASRTHAYTLILMVRPEITY